MSPPVKVRGSTGGDIFRTPCLIEDLLAEDDRVVVRMTLKGTHEGEFKGIAPTHKPFAIRVTATARFEDGKLVEYWSNPDLLGLMQQLGAIEG